MLNKNQLLEMWKMERIISSVEALVDPIFLSFVWIMGWKGFFWFYLVGCILSMIGRGVRLVKLERSLGVEKI